MLVQHLTKLLFVWLSSTNIDKEVTSFFSINNKTVRRITRHQTSQKHPVLSYDRNHQGAPIFISNRNSPLNFTQC